MRIYPFFIPHAGCPHRCLFCQQQRTSGRSAAPTVEEVAGELERILPPRGGGEVAFYGGSFTLLPWGQQLSYLEAVAPHIAAGRVGGVRLSTRPDALSGDAAMRLRRFGVTTVELGCQSFCAEVLGRSGRGHGPDEAAGAVGRLREAGLAVGLQLMPGLPGGGREEALFSLGEAMALAPDFLRIYPTLVLSGTALERLWARGEYRPLGLDEAVDFCAEMLWRCRLRDLPVIRLGLQATPEFDRGEGLLAGPYHGAFGQLVRSRLWLNGLRRLCAESGAEKIHVHPADLSDVIGHRRANIRELQGAFDHFVVATDAGVPRDCFLLGGRHFSLMQVVRF